MGLFGKAKYREQLIFGPGESDLPSSGSAYKHAHEVLGDRIHDFLRARGSLITGYENFGSNATDYSLHILVYNINGITVTSKTHKPRAKGTDPRSLQIDLGSTNRDVSGLARRIAKEAAKKGFRIKEKSK